MNIVNMHQAKTNLSKLVKQACDGEEIIIGKAGEPLVRIIPFKAKKKERKPGSLKGKIWMADDFDEIPDCFAPYIIDQKDEQVTD